MARMTVSMPFSGSTRPTTPTMGFSGRLLSRALQERSGEPGQNCSGSTPWGITRSPLRSAPTAFATARLTAMALDARRTATLSTRRPSPGRTKS